MIGARNAGQGASGLNVNIERLRTLATSLRGNLQKIRRYADLPEDEFWQDERNIMAVKLLLIQAIEDAASICAHLLARLGGQAATGYPDCFEKLQQLGVVEAELSKRLTLMARFRNLLVHRYWEVDDQRVLQFARHDVADLEEFLRAVGEFLNAQL
jgi:uncharacterized protein YutE (UPF0331/DUF86 family)